MKNFFIKNDVLFSFEISILIGTREEVREDLESNYNVQDPIKKFPDNVDGLTISKIMDNGHYVIVTYINSKGYHPDFTLDHELGHINTYFREFLKIKPGNDELYIRFWNWLKRQSPIVDAMNYLKPDQPQSEEVSKIEGNESKYQLLLESHDKSEEWFRDLKLDHDLSKSDIDKLQMLIHAMEDNDKLEHRYVVMNTIAGSFISIMTDEVIENYLRGTNTNNFIRVPSTAFIERPILSDNDIRDVVVKCTSESYASIWIVTHEIGTAKINNVEHKVIPCNKMREMKKYSSQQRRVYLISVGSCESLLKQLDNPTKDRIIAPDELGTLLF